MNNGTLNSSSLEAILNPNLTTSTIFANTGVDGSRRLVNIDGEFVYMSGGTNLSNFHPNGDGGGFGEHPGHVLSPFFANLTAFLFILIIVISVCCNMVLILIIVRVKKLHTIMHVFIVNLAISDLITAAGTMPFDVDFMLRGYFDHGIIACGVMNFTFLISLPSSVMNLVLLTTERLISVVFPFQRMRYLNKRNVIIVLISAWVYTFTVALYPMVHGENTVVVQYGHCWVNYPISYDIFQLIANFSIPIIFICFANCVLFYISSKHAYQIRTLTVPANNNERTDSLSFESDDEESVEKQQRRTSFTPRHSSIINIKINLRAAKKLTLLVGVFLFCWLTYIVLVATNISCGICHPRELTWMGNVINYSSSAVNPVIYGLLNTQIRREIKKPLRQLMNKLNFLKDANSTYQRKRTNTKASFYSDTIARSMTGDSQSQC